MDMKLVAFHIRVYGETRGVRSVVWKSDDILYSGSWVRCQKGKRGKGLARALFGRVRKEQYK